ncbi:MAG: NAD(P)-dependent oxidoreductase [Bacteroidia bacterium]
MLKRGRRRFSHIPSNEENLRFFDAEKFARMKSDAVLINIARGEVVDEEALFTL